MDEKDVGGARVGEMVFQCAYDLVRRAVGHRGDREVADGRVGKDGGKARRVLCGRPEAVQFRVGVPVGDDQECSPGAGAAVARQPFDMVRPSRAASQVNTPLTKAAVTELDARTAVIVPVAAAAPDFAPGGGAASSGSSGTPLSPSSRQSRRHISSVRAASAYCATISVIAIPGIVPVSSFLLRTRSHSGLFGH
ncbi:hypothetical protein F9B16_35050 [Actinomadura montaniterrae]|uniref:Uncharacterized protein n=1 Tax=Actinomadura montaniterrae TaxID=1803903 RepID=A0A6L3VJ06_9ACTN|nr:hypothetical protein [Actinomadura montaniterrae]KAB2370621.1 hypothetical protein F9B16_35050 [Actinomadura montaniterrae]